MENELFIEGLYLNIVIPTRTTRNSHIVSYNKRVIQQEILQLVKKGKNKSYIRDTLKVSEHLITKTKKDYQTDNLPPLEQAIQMLELSYSEDEVYAWWGEELLEEAKTWLI